MIADEPIKAVVTEGPGIGYSFPQDEAVAEKDFPYAMRLSLWLRRNGVKVEFHATPPGSSIALGAEGTVQLVTKKDLPEKMGQAIVTRLGCHVAFLELPIPNSPNLYVSWHKSSGVWVRHIVDYSIVSDDFRQRWDVLVKAVKAVK